MGHFNYENSAKVNSNGASGGIYALWNNNLSVQTISQNPQELYLFVKVNHSSFPPFSLVDIYSKPYPHEKCILWTNIKNFLLNNPRPNLVVGDFNDILSPNEKSEGLKPSEEKMHAFRKKLRWL